MNAGLLPGCEGFTPKRRRFVNVLRLTLLCACASAHAGPSWQEALRAMPLPPDAPMLNRDNAVAVLLQAFRSNAVVKGLLVLPEVADDFYLIHRDAPKLNVRATNLLDALTRLTNVTELRLTFREPFLLVHLPGDRLDAVVTAEDAAAVRRLKSERGLGHGVFADAHWERMQPRLAAELQRRIEPRAESQDAWHFARHNFAGWNLTGWELLTAVALTGNSTVTVQKSGIQFRERSAR